MICMRDTQNKTCLKIERKILRKLNSIGTQTVIDITGTDTHPYTYVYRDKHTHTRLMLPNLSDKTWLTDRQREREGYRETEKEGDMLT